MSLFLIGTNHRYSSLAVREKLFFSKRDTLGALGLLLENPLVRGAVILSTCHRVEIYAESDDIISLRELLPDADRYIKKNEEVVSHLFDVAAGLDSQIIGEGEILRQVKEAYSLARGFEATTSLLNKVFERALFVGKLVRCRTSIAKRDPSLAGAAVELAEKAAGGLSKKRIFIIGAGTVAQRLAQRCRQKGASCIFVANRTFQRAKEIAGQVHGKAIRFDEFYLALDSVDLIFSATASRHLVLKKDVFAAFRDTKKKMVLFDLAVPRDIDPDIGRLENVTLFNLDDFRDEGRLSRAEILKAQTLVKEKLQRFLEREYHLWRSGSVYAPALLR